jgi:hypothetical protein
VAIDFRIPHAAAVIWYFLYCNYVNLKCEKIIGHIPEILNYCTHLVIFIS